MWFKIPIFEYPWYHFKIYDFYYDKSQIDLPWETITNPYLFKLLSFIKETIGKNWYKIP